MKSYRRFLVVFTIISVLGHGLIASSVLAQQKVESTRSSPADTTIYTRPAVPEDFAPGDRGAVSPLPEIFIRDVAVLAGTGGGTEPSIAINPANPNQIVIHAGFGGWNANASVWETTDGGVTWTLQTSIPAPPGGVGTAGCPCDTVIDYGRNNLMSGTFLATPIYSGTTSNPASGVAWNWFTSGTPPVTQTTNRNNSAPPGSVDQPWLVVTSDPNTVAQDNLYVAYDDFLNGNDCSAANCNMRVSVSYGANPPNFTVDNQSGTAIGNINPGHRLADDPRTGFVYSAFQRNIGAGAGGSKNIDYMLNRSTDGGATWTLNGNAGGIIVANADSTQPTPKFGTVNALLGGVDHIAVDPTTGDVYYAYGNRDAGTGNNRLAIRRLTSNGTGGLTIGSQSFVTGQVQAALPAVAVLDDGTVGVFYYSFDGFSSDNFPIFTAHLALSDDQGLTFTNIELLRFLSAATDDTTARQRVLGDYVQLKSLDNCFYGVFTGNGVPFGRTTAQHDPIFYKTCRGPQIQVPGNLAVGDTCVGNTNTATLNVCNTGVDNLNVSSISSSNTQFVVTTPSSGYPVVISPDFCFPFQVSFTPTSTGAKTSTLTITSNDPANPSVNVQATGNGSQQQIATLIADNGSFGNVCVGAFKDLNLIINNSGGCVPLPLTINGISSSSPEFQVAAVMSFPLTIAPGGFIQVPIRFQPTSPGPKTANITVSSNDPTAPSKVVVVSGNSPTGEIRATGSTDFGDICSETHPERTVAMCNVGACNLAVTAAALVPACPDFTFVNNPFPATVSPNSCLNLTIRYVGIRTGPKSCDLVVTSNTPTLTTAVTAFVFPEFDPACRPFAIR
jgi:hypothetical protein